MTRKFNVEYSHTDNFGDTFTYVKTFETKKEQLTFYDNIKKQGYCKIYKWTCYVY